MGGQQGEELAIIVAIAETINQLVNQQNIEQTVILKSSQLLCKKAKYLLVTATEINKSAAFLSFM